MGDSWIAIPWILGIVERAPIAGPRTKDAAAGGRQLGNVETIFLVVERSRVMLF